MINIYIKKNSDHSEEFLVHYFATSGMQFLRGWIVNNLDGSNYQHFIDMVPLTRELVANSHDMYVYHARNTYANTENRQVKYFDKF